MLVHSHVPAATKRVLALSAVVVAGGALIASPAQAAQTACTPDAGYAYCETFDYSGADQTFTVPAGVTTISVEMWGAAGAGSAVSTSPTAGGAGGFVTGVLPVTPGDVLTLIVGQGGTLDTTQAYGGGGGGGAGIIDTNTGPGSGPAAIRNGGGGGGRSGIEVDGTERATAGGGGGEPGQQSSAASPAPYPQFAIGGGGGGLVGGADTNLNQTNFSCAFNSAGAGGTQTGGGAGGQSGVDASGLNPVGDGIPGSAGSAFTGGDGGDAQMDNATACFDGANDINGGGGGGGGYFGGGGGAGNGTTEEWQETGGGGGSSYLDGLTGASTIAGATAIAGVNAAAPNATDAHYVTGVARGGTGTMTGGNGLIVLQYNVEAAPSVAKPTLAATGRTDVGAIVVLSSIAAGVGGVLLATRRRRLS